MAVPFLAFIRPTSSLLAVGIFTEAAMALADGRTSSTVFASVRKCNPADLNVLGGDSVDKDDIFLIMKMPSTVCYGRGLTKFGEVVRLHLESGVSIVPISQ